MKPGLSIGLSVDPKHLPTPVLRECVNWAKDRLKQLCGNEKMVLHNIVEAYFKELIEREKNEK